MTEEAKAESALAPGPRPWTVPEPRRLAPALIVLLAAFALLPSVSRNPRLVWAMLGAAGALLLLFLAVTRRAAKTGRVLSCEVVLKPVHYVQLLMHSAVYAYWGFYWREVYHQIPLILAQIVFVYALDMLTCWSRRDRWILGFGAVPIVLSTNLFLFFKPDWYFLQFLMLAAGVLGKEFITWERDGRRSHVFNPSAIALFLCSMVLIAAHGTSLTWGREIAISFNNPGLIYVEIFLLGLVVQTLFAVTLVTLSAAAALYALNLAYMHATGLYFFGDTGIPAAVFLGVHLLITDPATSPRSNLGKAAFGAAYGAAVFGLYWVLDPFGLSFYDKLLCVPPLNLSVRLLDRASASLTAGWRTPAWWPAQANRVHMAVWVCLFTVMVGTGFMKGPAPGFWREACAANRPTACERWSEFARTSCLYDSGTACLELATASAEGRAIPRDLVKAGKSFARACDLGLADGCAGLVALVERDGGDAFQRACEGGDGESCFLLGSLSIKGRGLVAGRGLRENAARGVALLGRSCEAGFPRGCFGLGESYRTGSGTTADDARAIESFDKACAAGMAPSCYAAASLYAARRDQASALGRLREGCAISAAAAESRPAYVPEGALARRIEIPDACASVLD
jgi:hypothetical protein